MFEHLLLSFYMTGFCIDQHLVVPPVKFKDIPVHINMEYHQFVR